MMPVRPWTPEVSLRCSCRGLSGSRTELLDKHFADFSRVRWQQKLAALGVDPAHSLVVLTIIRISLREWSKLLGLAFGILSSMTISFPAWAMRSP